MQESRNFLKEWGCPEEILLFLGFYHYWLAHTKALRQGQEGMQQAFKTYSLDKKAYTDYIFSLHLQ